MARAGAKHGALMRRRLRRRHHPGWPCPVQASCHRGRFRCTRIAGPHATRAPWKEEALGGVPLGGAALALNYYASPPSQRARQIYTLGCWAEPLNDQGA